MTTDIYTTPSSAYIREIMARWVMHRIWVLAAILAVLAVLAATVDTAFIFVALMVAFIVIPMGLSMVYFNYGLKPEATRWSLSKKLSLKDHKILIEYQPRDDGRPVPKPEEFPLDRVIDLSTKPDGDVIRFGQAPDDFLIVGNDAFPLGQECKQESFRSFIYQSIQDNLLTLRSP